MKNSVLFFIIMLTGNWLSAQNNLVAYVYWFNVNESRQIETFVPAAQHLLSTDIDASGLPDGVNVFNIRYKDENGVYSSTLSQLFYKNTEQLTLNKKLVSYEYWFNNDNGSKKIENLTPAAQHSLSTNIDVSSLPDGVNVLNIRYKEENGIYSSTLSTLFYKSSTNQVSDNKIIAYRYWLNSGFDQAKTVELASGVSPILLVDDLDLATVPKGRHAIHFHFQDLLGAWSMVSTDSITKTANPVAAFTFSNTTFCTNGSVNFVNESSETDTWLWDFGDGSTSTEFEPEHVYTAVGDFDVSLIATDLESGLRDTVVHSIAVYSPKENPTSAEICSSELPYSFGTQELTESGIYTETFQTVHGCDSLVTLNLTVHPSYSSTATCSGILVTSATPSETENRIQIVQNDFGEGASFADWNDLKAIADIDAWISCMNLHNNDLRWLTWNGAFNNGSRHYFVAYFPGGAASSFAVHDQIGGKLFLGSWYGLNMPILAKGILSNAPVNVEICASETPYTFGTQQLSASGDYTETFQTIHGCDSIVTLNLLVNPVYDENETVTVCDIELPYVFGIQALTSSGGFTETFQSVSGCDSVVNLTLVVNPTYNEIETKSVCSGELPVTFGSQLITTGGIYLETFQTIFGCDSVVTLNLMVNPSYSSVLSLENVVAYYPFNGNANDESGNSNNGTVYGARLTTDKDGNLNGAYSFDGVNDYISCVQPGPAGTSPRTICFWAKIGTIANDKANVVISYGGVASSFNYGDRIEIGLQSRGLTASVGGTSLVREFDSSDNDWHFYAIVYDGTTTTKIQDFKFYADGQLLTNTIYNLDHGHTINTGTYPIMIGNLIGIDRYFKGELDEIKVFDKVLTEQDIQNEFNSGLSKELTICASETPYTFGTQQLSASGQYTEIFQTIHGCDSIVTLNLVVNPVYAENETVTICESEFPYIFGTQSLTNAGNYTETFYTINGCDSVITLTLTVKPAYNEVETKIVCSTELPVIFGSQSLTIGGNYSETFKSIGGCDSLVALTLTVNPSYNKVETVTICESEFPYIFGTQSLVSSGNYSESFQTVNGCDSFVNLTLNVNLTYNEVETKTVCSTELPVTFASQSLTIGGNYSETFQSIGGCDSIVNLSLVVNEIQHTILSDFIYIEDLPYIFESQNLTKTGIYSETLSALNGCDSIIILTLTVIDTSIVNDKTPPAVNCNEIDIYLNNEGRYVLKPDDFKALSAGTTDNVSAAENIQISVFRKSFNCNDSGREVEVEVTASDEAGNEASCSVVLLIQDTFALKIEPVEDIEMILAPGICETEISYPALITPNFCADFTQISGLGVDGVFPIGITMEEWILSSSDGDTLAFSFNVTVSSNNDLPTIDPIANISINEDLPELKIPISGISYGKDCNPQNIEVKVSGINSTLITNVTVDYSSPDSNAIVNLTFAHDMIGTDEVTVIVTDSEGLSVTESFNVFVKPVTDLPKVVNPIPDLLVNASFPIKFPIINAPDGIFGEEDNNELTFELFMEDGNDFPEWITIEGDSLICVPMIADTGCFSIVLKAMNSNGGMARDTFSICVDGYPTGNTDLETTTFDIHMYPNPTTGEVNLRINTSAILDSEVIVRNIAGSEVFRKEYKATKNIKIDLSNHVSGIYLLTLKSGDKSVVKKLILDRK